MSKGVIKPMQQALDSTATGRRAKDEADILFIGFVGGNGGASVLMLELAIRLGAVGLRTKIVVPDWQATEEYARRCQSHGIRVERSPWLIEHGSRPGYFFKVLRFLRKYRAPIVHYQLSANTLHHFFLYAMDMLSLPPSFVTLQTNLTVPEPGDKLAQLWAAAANRHFNKVITVSERARQRQIQYGVSPEHVEVISNGVDIKRFSRGDPVPVRRRLGVANDARLIIFTGRMEQDKRPLEALKAFLLIASEFPSAHILFLGQGPLESETRAEAERAGLRHRVHLPGYQNNVEDWLAASSLFLLPTESEGCSVSVLEAMAAGCPVVTTACPGNDEMLTDGKNALLVPVGDVQQMAVSMRRLLKDDTLGSNLSANARQTAEQYSLEKMVDKHLACYDKARR